MEESLNDPEPPSVQSDAPACWDLALKQLSKKNRVESLMAQDVVERDGIGKAKYGVRLQPFNGRRPLKDLYQELLDAVAYATQEAYEAGLVGDPDAQLIGFMQTQLICQAGIVRDIIERRRKSGRFVARSTPAPSGLPAAEEDPGRPSDRPEQHDK